MAERPTAYQGPFPCPGHRSMDQLPVEDPTSFRAHSRRLVQSLIDREADPSEKKARILLAMEHGHLSPAEAEEWIALAALEDA